MIGTPVNGQPGRRELSFSYSSAQDQIADLNLLLELNEQLSTGLELRPILEATLAAALAVSGTDMGLLFLCDEREAGQDASVSRGLREECQSLLPGVPDTRVVIEDTENEALFEGSREAARFAGVRAIHATPISGRSGQILGVLTTFSRAPRRPSDREMHLLDRCARQAGPAIENALLHQSQLQKLIERKSSEARLRAIVQATPECIKQVSIDGMLLDMNRTGLGMIEMDTQEVPLRACVYDLIAPEYRDAFRAFNERVCAGEGGMLEFDIIGLKGTRRHLETHAVPLREADRITHLAVTRDVTARRRAEEALRESEQRQRNLADNLPSGFIYQIVVEADNVSRRFTYVSGGVERLCGVTPAEVLADPTALMGMILEEDRLLVQAAEEAAIREHKPFDFQFRIRVRGGGIRWLHSRSAPRPLGDGGTVWDGLALDMTEQKQAEQALRESEAQFRRLASAGIIGIIRWNLDRSLILDANDEFLRMTGYERADLEAGGLNFRDMTPPEWTQRNEVGIRDLRSTGVGGAYEKEYFRKDGSRVPVIIVGVRFEDVASEGMSFVLDITERKRAEEAVRASEARYRTLLESIEEGFCVIEVLFEDDNPRDVKILEVNPAFEKLTGLRDAVGKTIHSLLPSHDDSLLEVYGRVVREGIPIRTVNEARNLDSRWFDVSAFPLGGAKVAILFNDITAQRQAQMDREHLVEQLRESDRKKDDFIALLAHELRNPLAPIRNGLQVMRLASGNGSEVAQARAMMERQLSHMVRLVDDLLDVSRISRNKMELRRQHVALADVLSTAVETARPLIDAGRHELTVSLPTKPVYLEADLTRLAQVFSNLLTNSARYTNSGGQISLLAERRHREVVVSVRDNGIGIPPESLDQIFDMFSQVDRSLERSTGGLGIGLALVKGLVEMHGGSVLARSEGQGKGSTFAVTLPLVESQMESNKSTPEVDLTVVRPARKILVVDDNRDGANSLSILLRLLKNEVYTVHDGVEAVVAAEKFRPDVILMDVGMPRLNGLDATRKIRAQPWSKGIRIIALTGWGQDGDRERSREAGCDGHLVKPVNLPELEQLLQS